MHRYFLFLIGFLVITSCDRGTVYSKYRATNNGGWGLSDSIAFEFNAPDTLTRHNLYINVRNDDRFPFSNLFLIASMHFPDGKIIRDTLEYQMAEPDGSWMGKGTGSIKENKLWYKENIVFPLNGVYSLKVVHAMRNNGSVDGVQSLPGITDVGLEIEKSNQ